MCLGVLHEFVLHYINPGTLFLSKLNMIWYDDDIIPVTPWPAASVDDVSSAECDIDLLVVVIDEVVVTVVVVRGPTVHVQMTRYQ